MIASSKDLLFLVLAFCVLWVTIFLCWALYYLIAILRDAKWTVQETREKVEMIGRLIDTIQEKIHSSGTYFGLATRAMMQFVEHMQKRRGTSTEETIESVLDDVISPNKSRARKKS